MYLSFGHLVQFPFNLTEDGFVLAKPVGCGCRLTEVGGGGEMKLQAFKNFITG